MRKYYLLPDVEKKKYLELLIDAGKSASLSSDEALDSYLRQVAEGEERRVDLERLSSIRGMLLATVVLIVAWNLPMDTAWRITLTLFCTALALYHLMSIRLLEQHLSRCRILDYPLYTDLQIGIASEKDKEESDEQTGDLP